MGQPSRAGFLLIRPVSTAELAAYYDLRWRVLRSPWHQPRGTERDDLEWRSLHLLAQTPGGAAAAVGRLHFNAAATAQVRYLATDPAYRGLGAARAVMQTLEWHARRAGAERIFLNARVVALDFYERVGYRVMGEGHLLYGTIRHQQMEKVL